MKKANKTPTDKLLALCGDRCFQEGWTNRGLESYERSNMSPTKEKLLACASKCFMDKNKDEGRRAIVEANKASE